MARPKRNKRENPSEAGAPLDFGGEQLGEQLVAVNRTTKVNKGGRRFNFSALVVCGNRAGKVGYGFGKAREVADAVRKATDAAKKNLREVKLRDATIPHEVVGHADGSQVLLRPASPGTGIIAGGAVRAVVSMAGVKDVLAKSLGSNNPINVVKATLEALSHLKTREEVIQLRGRQGNGGSEK